MLGGFTRSLSALVHFTLHKGAAVDSVVYIVHVEYMDPSMRDGWAVLQSTPTAQPSRSNTADRSGCSTFSTGSSMQSVPGGGAGGEFERFGNH